MTTYPCCPHCVDDQPHVPLDSHTLPCTTCEAESRTKALAQACVPEGCQCMCHRYPGVSHIRACCEQPTYYHPPTDTHAPIEVGAPAIEQRSSRLHRLGVKDRPDIEIAVTQETYDYLLTMAGDQVVYSSPLALSDHEVFWDRQVLPVIEQSLFLAWCQRKVQEVRDAAPATIRGVEQYVVIEDEMQDWMRIRQPDDRSWLPEDPQEQMSREGHEVDRAYREERLTNPMVAYPDGGRAQREKADRFVERHQPREHAVLCTRCRKVTTWNVDAICDPCLDRLPEAPEWTL